MPAFLVPLLPYVFKIGISVLGTIAVDIYRRKANVEKSELKQRISKLALDRIDQIIIGKVGKMELFPEKQSLDKETVFRRVKKEVYLAIPKDLMKEAEKAVDNLEKYIDSGIENAVLEIKLKKGNL